MTPILFGVLDDRSRLACHLQWYLAETAEIIAHGLSQAFQKRGLPRSALSDNGAAMTAAEITQGLTRLGILHQTTLPYSPYQNAKQEAFWGPVEGRLMAMFEGLADFTLAMLNEATQAWAEFDHNRKIHSEIGEAPITRFLAGPDVTRPCPDSAALRLAFTRTDHRMQRKSDGTVGDRGPPLRDPQPVPPSDAARSALRRLHSPAPSISSTSAPARAHPAASPGQDPATRSGLRREDALHIVRRRLEGISGSSQCVVGQSLHPGHHRAHRPARSGCRPPQPRRDRRQLAAAPARHPSIRSYVSTASTRTPAARSPRCSPTCANCSAAHHVAVLVVHHAKKGGGGVRAGQALRHSLQFHAWGDSNLDPRRDGDDLSLSA